MEYMKKINCPCGFSPKELLFFNKLIMPSILTIIYWIVLAFVVLGGLISMATVSVLGGLIGILVGIVSTRITFELICVVFSINRNLEKLVMIQSGSPDDVSTPEKVGAEADANASCQNNKDDNNQDD